MDVERLTATTFKYTPVALPAVYQRVFMDHMHRYRIPRNEIFKSSGILKQNPGW